MGEKDESIENILIDEEEAKKQFLEELRTKNLEETKAFEKAALEKALLEKAINDEKLREEEKALEEIASDTHDDTNIHDDTKEDNKDENKEVSIKEHKKIDGKFVSTLKEAVIDTSVTAIASIVALYLFDTLLRLLAGYYVVDFKGVYIITFIIILVLYPVLMQNSKCGKTLGQKLSKVEVKEREE